MVLILKSITRVAFESANVQYKSSVRASDIEVFILSIPVATVNISHIDSHRRAVVGSQLMHGLKTEPILQGWVSETMDILPEISVELYGAVVPALKESAAVHAPGV